MEWDEGCSPGAAAGRDVMPPGGHRGELWLCSGLPEPARGRRGRKIYCSKAMVEGEREGAGSRLLTLLTSKEVDSSPTPEQTQVLRPVKAWLNFTMECRLPRSRNQLRGAPAVRAKSQCAIEGVDAPCCSEARLKCWDDRPAF
ncbi:unnamed protein product [Rangifer tarandus platyrhynchus]|uniref:Uncharacterized protein n=2 Tax=Rangifer tarandus platyrhynchus TaxID=3082113 RepID=A0AC60A4L7_RANTA|nr:unnamed protein product [Rangifer tarandus platyrhynchus]